jgi:phycoerythrin-associated linker protein
MAPAFVSAAPALRTSAFTPNAPTASTSSRPSTTPAVAPAPCAALTSGPEFQQYAGGLDRINQDPYSVTRFLFKAPPSVDSTSSKDESVAAALRHVFGNAYLMEEERAGFYSAESRFRCGAISAKEFVRAIAKSSTYKARFFDSVSQFRFVELSFKHLLGRAPLDQVEYSKYFKIFALGGYGATVDALLDDGEYDTVFGEDCFPFTRFRGTYAPISQFNRMCRIEGGWAGSDKAKPQALVSSLASNTPIPAFSIADGLPPIPNSEHPTNKYNLPDASLERYRNETEVAGAKAYQLQIELDSAYANLEKARSTINPFKSMVADMKITPIFGRNYDGGKVQVFAGQYAGAPKGGFGGPSGVENIAGPSRGAARIIAKKEKQLESIKQLIVDLQRKVSNLEGERGSPATTPEQLIFTLDGIDLPESAFTRQVVDEPFEGTSFAGTGFATGTAFAPVGTGSVTVRIPDAADSSSEADEDAEDAVNAVKDATFVPSKIKITTSRRADDDMLGPNPGELIEKMEEERIASGKDFLGGLGGKISFPGDGSEMNIGS